jgi:nickel superoxide dismutase
MIYKALNALDEAVRIKRAKAHCDVPCGIYDPITAQIAALTVVRMIDLMEDLAKSDTEKGLAYHNTLSRHIAVKEEHAEKAKHDIRVIWGDYIKPHHVEAHPEVHGVAHKIMQLGSKIRQTTDRETAVQFVEAINQFAELFWKTREVATHRAKAPYAPGLELVYPDL